MQNTTKPTTITNKACIYYPTYSLDIVSIQENM